MTPRAALAIGFTAGVLASAAVVAIVVTSPLVTEWVLL